MLLLLYLICYVFLFVLVRINYNFPFSLVEPISENGRYCDALHNDIASSLLDVDHWSKAIESNGPVSGFIQGFLKTSLKNEPIVPCSVPFGLWFFLESRFGF